MAEFIGLGAISIAVCVTRNGGKQRDLNYVEWQGIIGCLARVECSDHDVGWHCCVLCARQMAISTLSLKGFSDKGKL